jgi:hypothetical protein
MYLSIRCGGLRLDIIDIQLNSSSLVSDEVNQKSLELIKNCRDTAESTTIRWGLRELVGP